MTENNVVVLIDVKRSAGFCGECRQIIEQLKSMPDFSMMGCMCDVDRHCLGMRNGKIFADSWDEEPEKSMWKI